MEKKRKMDDITVFDSFGVLIDIYTFYNGG